MTIEACAAALAAAARQACALTANRASGGNGWSAPLAVALQEVFKALHLRAAVSFRPGLEHRFG